MVHPSATTSKIDRIPRVLVGVDGTAASWDALAWAEQELMTHSTDAGPRHLRICRAYPAETAAGRTPNAVDSATLARLDPGMHRRLRSTGQRWASDDITVDRYVGSLATQLIAHATPDTVAVISASTRDTAVVTRVAASARGVVVAVRATTPPIGVTAGPFAGHVIVGVDGRSSDAAVRFAFDYAARHRHPIAAVHAHAHDDAGVWVDDDVLPLCVRQCGDGNGDDTGGGYPPAPRVLWRDGNADAVDRVRDAVEHIRASRFTYFPHGVKRIKPLI